ncbi:MAG: zinc ribbon domain-containing protein [Thermoplasmata archaeon]
MAGPPVGAAAPPPPPPPPPPGAAASPCRACGAPIPPGTKFCPQCGAAVSGSSAPTGTPPVDLRQRVDEDRGTLKRLQLLVPGYRGYRLGEDSREADSILRLQVADKVHASVVTIQNCRAQLTQASQFQALTELAPILSELMRLEGEIRHAEQGYTGISPAVRITPQNQDKLYEYDYGFAQASDQVTQTLAPLATLASQSNGVAVTALVATVRGQVNQLDQAFRARLRVIENVNLQQ